MTTHFGAYVDEKSQIPSEKCRIKLIDLATGQKHGIVDLQTPATQPIPTGDVITCDDVKRSFLLVAAVSTADGIAVRASVSATTYNGPQS